jgi:hypothetical protein
METSDRDVTAVEILKLNAADLTRINLPEVLTRFYRDKQCNLHAWKAMAQTGTLGWAIEQLLLRTQNSARGEVFKYLGDVPYGQSEIKSYRASERQNVGVIAQTPHDPNISVIPGMLHRLGDLMFGVVMRAFEAQYLTKEA